MRRRVLWLAVLAVVPLLAVQGMTPGPTLAGDPDRVIVVFNGAGLPSDADDIVRAAGGAVVQVLPALGVVVAEAIGGTGDALADRLRRAKGVQGVGPDIQMDLIGGGATWEDPVVPGINGHTVVDFPFQGNPPDWFYTSTAQQWSVKRIGAQGGGVAGGSSPGAWDVTFGANVKIAILDTGVAAYHRDIAPNLIYSVSFAAPNMCDDGSPADQFGHGTWTASLAAGAKGPGTGLLIGVAPQAQILNIKVLRRTPLANPALSAFERCRQGTGSGSFSWILAGIIDAVRQGADVISMSIGGMIPRNSPGGGPVLAAFNRAVNYAIASGAIVIAAAGNDGLDLNKMESMIVLPSEASNVITVMATTNPAFPPNAGCAGVDCLASYSNHGSSLYGLAAPGGSGPGGAPPGPTGLVRGACSAGLPGTDVGFPASSGLLPVGSFGCVNSAVASQHNWYVAGSGTSAATPIVAGAAALLKASNPGLSPSQVRTKLQQTADDIGKPGYDEFFNFGLVNACKAVGANCP